MAKYTYLGLQVEPEAPFISTCSLKFGTCLLISLPQLLVRDNMYLCWYIWDVLRRWNSLCLWRNITACCFRRPAATLALSPRSYRSLRALRSSWQRSCRCGIESGDRRSRSCREGSSPGATPIFGPYTGPVAILAGTT